jgi:predicted nucleic acid-binding protein
MIVVSDTSPINYLVLIEFQDRRPELFERILIPEAVRREGASTTSAGWIGERALPSTRGCK